MCIALFLLTILQDFVAIMPLYSTGHISVELTLYQTVESGKDTSFIDQTTVAMSQNKQLIDTDRKECKGCTERVNGD